jgi:hypothetical protein
MQMISIRRLASITFAVPRQHNEVPDGGDAVRAAGTIGPFAVGSVAPRKIIVFGETHCKISNFP